MPDIEDKSAFLPFSQNWENAPRVEGENRPVPQSPPSHGGARPPIRGIIFDFDGLILDTEEPEYRAWATIYEEYGCELPLDRWTAAIGTTSGAFDPCSHLEWALGGSLSEPARSPAANMPPKLDSAAIRTKSQLIFRSLLAAKSPLPGVRTYLQDAERLGLKMAVASSSPGHWIEGHLKRLELRRYFSCIRCADHVRAVKPDPALYLLALEALELSANEAVALEDSPNGVRAAKAAGLFCAAVPNAMTRGLDFRDADVILASLEETPLDALLKIQAESLQH